MDRDDLVEWLRDRLMDSFSDEDDEHGGLAVEWVERVAEDILDQLLDKVERRD